MALHCDMYQNTGNSLDLSAFVMEASMVRIDNAYKIPNANIVGHLCKTNQASNTAFRGFGGPQVSAGRMSVVLPWEGGGLGPVDKPWLGMG